MTWHRTATAAGPRRPPERPPVGRKKLDVRSDAAVRDPRGLAIHRSPGYPALNSVYFSLTDWDGLSHTTTSSACTTTPRSASDPVIAQAVINNAIWTVVDHRRPGGIGLALAACLNGKVLAAGPMLRMIFYDTGGAAAGRGRLDLGLAYNPNTACSTSSCG